MLNVKEMNASNYDNHNLSNNNPHNDVSLSTDNFVIPGVTEKQIKSLKDLPDNWFDEPINSLNRGQLLCSIIACE